MSNPVKYKLRFFFEWGGGCLWSGSDVATNDFGYGPLDTPDTKLPLSSETVRQCREMSVWYDTSFNWAYPPDPGPWRQTVCDQFNDAVQQLVATIRTELRNQFEVIDQQPRAVEDPDLHVYLAEPKEFRHPQQAF